MIIDKYVKYEIKSKKDINFLEKLNFKELNKGNIINLPIKYLTKGSHRLINVKCDNCNTKKKMQYNTYIRISKYGYYCNNKECINKKRELSIKKKYGVKNVFQLDKIKEKSKNTLINKYGKDNPQKVISIKKKTMETCKERYGHFNPFQSDKIKDRIKKTNLERYGVEYPQQSPEIRDKYSSLHKSSKVENELFDFINENTEEKLSKSYRLSGYELDVYIPKLKLAFEFNGLYWHNELTKDKNYHLNKTELCENNEIHLVHIYEDQWEFKKEIVKSRILNLLNKSPNKIYARKCEIKEISDNKLIRKFLDKSHIQGFVGSSIKLGLFYNDKLVSLMTFGKKRKMMNQTINEYDYELLRFCNILNTNVIGGANKLLKHFIRNYEYKSITTYADRSWSTGNLYKKMGFDYIGKTNPNYYYIIDRKRKYRFGFRKDILIKEGFDKNKSEHQIMLDRGIYRIYDSGNLKFILKSLT